jgi:hypothetical protein
MAWKFNFSTTGKYPTTVRKFLVDYLRVGEGQSQAKRTVGASVKRTIRGVSEVVKVDGVLRGRRRRHSLGKAIEVNGMLQAKRLRSRVKRSRRRRAPG